MLARRRMVAGLALALAGCATPDGMTPEEQEQVAAWKRSVQAAIMAKRYFPRDPTRPIMRASGVVMVSFSVGERGAIYTPQIARGSGEPLLDAAALVIVLSASPLPAPPPVLLRDSRYVAMGVPVSFDARPQEMGWRG